MATQDSYATAKANLRDNVKTLILVFGSIAGVMMAGTPFSGYGALTPLSKQWWIATISLLLTVILIGIALRLLLRALQPDLAYPEALHTQFNLDDKSRYERRELSALRKEFNVYKHQLLPKNIKSVEELEKSSNEAWARYQQSRQEKDKEAFDVHFDARSNISYWSAFTRLHYRIRTTIDVALLIGLLTLLSIAVFSLAVNASERSDGPSTPSNSQMANSTTASMEPKRPSTLAPITFEANSSGLSKPGLATVASTLELLRANPRTGVLIFGVTGAANNGSAVSRDLVNYRAHEIRRLLTQLGGISESRTFVIELPETATRASAPQEGAIESTVQIVLIPLALDH